MKRISLRPRRCRGAYDCIQLVFATGSKTARVGAHVRAVRHAWGGGGGWGGVGMMTFLALAHMVDATQVMGWGGHDDVPCTCTHGRCYASHGVGWGGVGLMTFLALATLTWHA